MKTRSHLKHLQRKSLMTPRWLTHVLRRVHPELFAGKHYSTAAWCGWEVLSNNLHNLHLSLFDHYGTDQQGRLVTEPYGYPDKIKQLARQFANKYKLHFSIEQVAWNHPDCTRVLFWPKEEWGLGGPWQAASVTPVPRQATHG